MKYSLLILSLLFTLNISAQEYIKLWNTDSMPNSRGMELNYSEENELISEVDEPGIYPFFTSNRENSGAAVVIFPPGGYAKLAYNVAGFSLAKWYNSIGINAFVVIYRLPNSPDLIKREVAPLQDAQRAMKIVRANANKWDIDPSKIGVMGSSSGGHIATTLATITDDYSIVRDSLDSISIRPDFTVLVSPVVSMTSNAHQGSIDNLFGEKSTLKQRKYFSPELNTTEQTPPAFIVHAQDDHVVAVQNSLNYFTALTQSGVTGCSLNIFPTGKHSIALRNKSSMLNHWTSLCESWLIERGIIEKR